MSSQRVANPAVPFLPGNSFRDPKVNSYNKKHIFDYKDGMTTMSDAKAAAAGEPELAPEVVKAAGEFEGSFMSPKKARGGTGITTETGHELPLSHMPVWLSYDRKVLRFYGYFKESVHESDYEQVRVRKVIFLYYLEDGQLQIQEPKVENCGLAQGAFLKRQYVNKPDGTQYGWKDLSTGMTMEVFSRVFRIVDCDEFTRKFYADQGVSLAPPEGYPKDQYKEHDEWVRSRNVPGKDDPMKRYYAAIQGAVDNSGRLKFLANDRKVLRFYGLWEDTANPPPGATFERRDVIVQFFRSDDTVEALEVHRNNSGRDPFGTLLKRARLPREFNSLADMNTVNYYTEKDFAVGNYISIFNRKVLLHDCDEYTRKYYQEVHGITFTTVKLPEVEKFVREEVIPPYNGYGSDADSLGSFHNLIPKPPKKDFYKINQFDKKVLRFVAEYAELPYPEDEGRRFVLQYYLADDTVAIFEPPIRNTGIVGGKYLERSRVKKDPNELVRPEYVHFTDFQIGNVVQIFQHRFRVIDCDLYTAKYLHMHPETWKPVDLEAVHSRLKKNLARHRADVGQAFREADMDRSGSITLEEFHNVLANFNFEDLTQTDIVALMHAWDHNGDGQISYDEFIATMNSSDEHQPDFSVPQQYLASLNEAAAAAMSDSKTRVALKTLRELVNASGSITNVLRKFDASGDGYISSQEFESALLSINPGVSDEEMALLKVAFQGTDGAQVDYNSFVKVLEG